MPGNLMTGTPARDAFNNGTQAIVGRHTLTAADTPASTKIGTIPAGAMILGIASRVVTAVAGGTPVLGISYVATGGTAPAVGTSGNLQNVMAEAAGSELVFPLAAAVLPPTTDVDIYVGSTGAATSGDVIVAVLFVKPLS
jgi:hypothetical protein